MSLQGEEGLWWDVGMKDLAVCFKSCNHVEKIIYAFTKKLLGPLWAEECLPWCAVCLWALMHTLYKYPGTKMKGCHYVANSNVWCVSFQPFSVLSSEVIHIYACKTLMCLLMTKAIGLMERGVPRAVSQVFKHISLFKSSHISLFSLLISACTVLFPSVFLYLLVWTCWVQLLPLVPCCVSPWILSLPFLSGCWAPGEAIADACAAHFMLLAGKLTASQPAWLFLPGNFCILPIKEFREDFVHEDWCVQSSHQHALSNALAAVCHVLAQTVQSVLESLSEENSGLGMTVVRKKRRFFYLKFHHNFVSYQRPQSPILVYRRDP